MTVFIATMVATFVATLFPDFSKGREIAGLIAMFLGISWAFMSFGIVLWLLWS